MEQVNELLKNELLNELNKLSKDELISQLMFYKKFEAVVNHSLFDIIKFNKTKPINTWNTPQNHT